MRTIQTNYHTDKVMSPDSRSTVLPAMVNGSREVLALLSAVTLAVAMVFLGIWVSDVLMSNVVGAATWAMAFAFFAFAIDSGKRMAVLYAITGIILALIAFLQIAVSSDFSIVTGAILAAWTAVYVFRLLR